MKVSLQIKIFAFDGGSVQIKHQAFLRFLPGLLNVLIYIDTS